MEKLKWFLLFFIGLGVAAFALFFVAMGLIYFVAQEPLSNNIVWGALGCGLVTGLFNGTAAAIRLS